MHEYTLLGWCLFFARGTNLLRIQKIIVTRQKFSNFGYFRNKSHELSMSKMKKVIHLYLYFMALYMHILLNCVCYQISYFFLSSTFHKFVQLLLLLLRNEKIVSSFNFWPLSRIHSSLSSFSKAVEFCTVVHVRNVSSILLSYF